MTMTLREKLNYVRFVDEIKYEIETYEGALKTVKSNTLRTYYTNQVAKLNVSLNELKASAEA
jgi:hypothetical protein